MAERRFLIVRLSALGDVIHALPMAAALKEAFPDAFVGWAAEKGVKPLLAGNPAVDTFILLDTKAWRRRGFFPVLGDAVASFRELRSFSFDTALDAQGLIKSGLIALLSGARERIGFERKHCREGLSSLFTNRHVAPPAGHHHIVEKNLALLAPLGIKPASPRFPLPSFRAYRLMVDTFLRRSGLGVAKPLIALHPGAGWPTKRWGEEKFARLGDALALRTGAQIIITWGPGDEGAASRVNSLMASEPRLAPALTLPQLACLLEHCLMFIGGDTGPLHLAAAMGVPVLGIYGPTTPWRNGPFGVEHALLYRPLPCSGCHKRSCRDPLCILSLTVEEALEAALELWGRVRERWAGRRVLEG